MEIAISVIAVCEVIRAVQNMIQIWMLIRDTGERDKAYRAVARSARRSDREVVERFLQEADEYFKNQEGGK